MILTNQADAMIFAAMKRGDYLSFAERNMREEFGDIVSICGWCDGAKERTKALTDAGKRVSHSICPACAKRMEAE